MPVEIMKLSDLHVSKLFQPREGGVDSDTVRDYATAISAGDKFPRMIAYRVTDRKFPGPVLVAGFHRLPAYRKAGIEEAEVEVRKGTYAEAWLGGYLSNLNNGLRYTNDDKRKAVATALLIFTGESNPVIADRLRVSDELVRKVRKELIAEGKIIDPETVIGSDGAGSPATLEQSTDDAESSPTVGEDSASSVDGQNDADSGISNTEEPEPDPDPAAEFNSRVNKYCRILDEVKAAIPDLANDLFGRHIHAESIALQIESARKALYQSRPTERCNCIKDDKPNEKCKACFGTGRCPAARVLKGGK